ncbi:MAG TPA: XRE family transcriptional regulator [Chloroflexota bacterium]
MRLDEAPAASSSEDLVDGELLGSLGRRLRELRRQRGLSLRQFGAATGFSPSFLSGVERGTSSPSISSLAVLAEALGSTLSALFLPPSSAMPVTRVAERQSFRLDGSPVEYVRLAAPIQGRSMEPIIATLPPWFEPREVDLSHRGEEFAMVLAGRMGITVAGRHYDLAVGDSIHFKSEVLHLWSNHHPDPAVVLWVNTPRLF